MRSHLAIHYSLKHWAVAALSQLFDGYTYTVRHGPLAGMKRRGGLGFLPFGPKPTAETHHFAQRDLAGQVVYDIGGFEGLVTLFFAARGRHVVVYEPNPASRARLQDNLALNDIENVTVRPVGVGERTGRATLVYDPLMPGAASANPAIATQIQDTARQLATTAMEVVTLDDDIRAQGLPAPDFVKIDVEGLELAVLRGMTATLRDRRPTIYIELHGATMPEKLTNVAAVVALLHDAGYRMQHVETGRVVIPGDSAFAARGHLAAEPV